MNPIPSASDALPENAEQETILFVDDEINILASLKRLFRSHG